MVRLWDAAPGFEAEALALVWIVAEILLSENESEETLFSVSPKRLCFGVDVA